MKSILICLMFLGFSLPLLSAESIGQNSPQSAAEMPKHAIKSDISFADSLILGLVEGITEYLPVSSTGHLIIANYFLGLDSDTPLRNSDGKIIYLTDGKSGEKIPYTMKSAADAYSIIIQIGAIAAVALLYWKTLLKMLMGLLGKDKNGLKLLLNIGVAFMPAAIVGLLLHDCIENFLFSVYPVIFALFAGGALMLVVQKRYDAQKSEHGRKFVDMYSMTLKQAFTIGALQCVAMWPGTSRSMMTILGGYIAGLKPAHAAQFSFLLGLATLSAASFFKIYKDGANIAQSISLAPLALGLAIAFASAAISVKWLVGFLTKHGLAPFAWYRFAIAALLLCLFIFF